MNTQARPYMNPYLAGMGLGVVFFAAVMVTGDGLGSSGSLLHLLGWTVSLILPEHATHAAYWASHTGGFAKEMNHPLVWIALGSMLGGLVSALIGKRFGVEVIRGPRINDATRIVFALIGGGLVGYAARLARGCTSGQGISGAMVLSVGSWAFLFGVFGGGYAVAWFVRKLWR